MKKFSKDQIESFNAAKEWMFTLRNVTNVFDRQKRYNSSKMLYLPYDVFGWYNAPERNQPLHMYKTPTAYKISCGKKYLEMTKFIENFTKQRKGDDEFVFGNFITRGYRLSYLWLQCERA